MEINQLRCPTRTLTPVPVEELLFYESKALVRQSKRSGM